MPMKKIEKYWLTVLWIALLMSSISVAEYSEEMQDAYDFAYKNGITTMDSIDQADMEGNLTRIAMAKMMSQYAINVLDKIPDNTKKCAFDDVSQELEWSYHSWATLACQLWLMGKGWEGKFNPYSIVTRAEFWTVLSRLLYQWEDGDPLYYAPHLAKLKEEGIIKNDDPNLKEQRWFLMLMLMRSNGTNEKHLTKEEVQEIIEKEEGLWENSISWKSTRCGSKSYLYEFWWKEIDWKPLIYLRKDNPFWVIKKVSDIWKDWAEKIALQDFWGSSLKIHTDCWESSDITEYKTYYVYITSENGLFIYKIKYDGTILWKVSSLNSEQVLQIMLKELNRESQKDEIKQANEDTEICKFRGSPELDWNISISYDCEFIFQWKKFRSWIDGKDGTFELRNGWEDYSYTDKNGEKVLITDFFEYKDSDTLKEILKQNYEISCNNGCMWSFEWEGKNKIFVWDTDDQEYYIDALEGKKMRSEDEMIEKISKDSGVSSEIIQNSHTGSWIFRESFWSWEVYKVFSFADQWEGYVYKTNLLNGEILDIKKWKEIWLEKAKEIAKEALEKQDWLQFKEYSTYWYDWNWLLIREMQYGQTWIVPSEPEYIITFVNATDDESFRVRMKHDGTIISTDQPWKVRFDIIMGIDGKTRIPEMFQPYMGKEYISTEFMI